MNRQVPYDNTYERRYIGYILPGQYHWIKHYLYPTWYRYSNPRKPSRKTRRQVVSLSNPLEDNIDFLDTAIYSNIQGARTELAEFYQQTYMLTHYSYQMGQIRLNPSEHYESFKEHLRKAKGFRDQLVKLTSV